MKDVQMMKFKKWWGDNKTCKMLIHLHQQQIGTAHEMSIFLGIFPVK